MIQTVVKRDGRIVGFNEQKIMAAIRKAMMHTDKGEDLACLYKRRDRRDRALLLASDLQLALTV